MKRYFVILLSFVTTASVFAQNFDDMPYSNPDRATYFQQEMTALMKFQAANNMNVPFFASFSYNTLQKNISKDYYDSLFDAPYKDTSNVFNNGVWNKSNIFESLDYWNDYENFSKGAADISGLAGGQIKINNMFYIPIFLQVGFRYAGTIIEEHTEIVAINHGTNHEYQTEMKGPATVATETFGVFAGGGLFINADKIKGGIYLGCDNLFAWDTERFEMAYNFGGSSYLIKRESDTGATPPSFKIALVPLLNTSEWAFIGKALDYIFGYFGMNDVLMQADTDEGESKAAAFAKGINAALDFSFNRIDWGPLSLNLNVLYTRGNFDAAAKADTYGAKLAGLVNGFPFGFTLEGGYKYFYSIIKDFEQDYPHTGYFTGSIYFPLKKITLGLIYQYNSVWQSTYSIAISTNFLKLVAGLAPQTDNSGKYKTGMGVNMGWRFHYNGWKAGK